MTKTFANYPDLTAALAFDLIDALKTDGISAQFGSSNQSCSTYANISVYDADDEHLDDFKVRFSDHGDRYGSDVTFRIDSQIEEVEDAFGDVVELAIEDWRYADLLADARSAAIAGVDRIREENSL